MLRADDDIALKLTGKVSSRHVVQGPSSHDAERRFRIELSRRRCRGGRDGIRRLAPRVFRCDDHDHRSPSRACRDPGDVVLDARAYHALRASVAQLPKDLRPDDPVRPLGPTERFFAMPTSPESLSVMILRCALTELASPASHTYRTSQNVRLQC